MKRYLLVWLVLYQHFLLAQTVPEAQADSILWEATYKLTWSDFQGKPSDPVTTMKAACAASIYIEEISDKLPNFITTNSFIKADAWTVDTSSTLLLAHEQLHFDIAEVFARKIRFAVDSLRRKKIADIAVYSTVITILLEERHLMGKQYDSETAHGIYLAQQRRWQAKVEKLLRQYQRYQWRLPS